MEASLNFLTIQAYLFNYAAKNEGAGADSGEARGFCGQINLGTSLGSARSPHEWPWASERTSDGFCHPPVKWGLHLCEHCDNN